jgi:hypothetical protein
MINVTYACSSTKEGGWVEFQDWDIHPKLADSSSLLATIARLVTEACGKSGHVPSPGPKLEGWLKSAGFTNVRCEKRSLPLGRWPEQETEVSTPLLQRLLFISAGLMPVLARS